MEIDKNLIREIQSLATGENVHDINGLIGIYGSAAN